MRSLWRVFWATFLMAGSVLAVVPAVSAAGDPITGTGYPEPRECREGQGWWRADPDQVNHPLNNTVDAGHVHVGICVPTTATPISGVLHLDVVIKLHENPGTAVRVAARKHTDAGDGAEVAKTINFECPPLTPNDCQTIVGLDYPMSSFDVSGLEQMNVKVHVNEMPVGDLALGVFRFPIRVANGKAVNDFDKRAEQGIGWYTCGGYAVSRLDSIATTSVPQGMPLTMTVSHTQFTSFEPDLDCAKSNNPVAGTVGVDPDFHGTDHGGVPFEGVNVQHYPVPCPAYQKTNCAGIVRKAITIPTGNLSVGTHKLYIKTDSPDAPCCGRPARGAVNSGLYVRPIKITAP